jgi:heme oxygenase (biliverdin-IX-beta and delta-forming)
MDPRHLREATRAEHEATEAVMPLMSTGLSLQEYRRVLEAMLPIVASWERWAGAEAPSAMRDLVAGRQRGDLLRDDLQFLKGSIADGEEGVSWAAVVNCPQGDDAFAAGFVGAMYVMEGSALGGRFIARHVEAALGLHAGQGDSYFQGYGERTGAMWREVLQVIAAVPEAQAETVIAAAKRAFAAFADALQRGLVARSETKFDLRLT